MQININKFIGNAKIKKCFHLDPVEIFSSFVISRHVINNPLPTPHITYRFIYYIFLRVKYIPRASNYENKLEQFSMSFQSNCILSIAANSSFVKSLTLAKATEAISLLELVIFRNDGYLRLVSAWGVNSWDVRPSSLILITLQRMVRGFRFQISRLTTYKLASSRWYLGARPQTHWWRWQRSVLYII